MSSLKSVRQNHTAPGAKKVFCWVTHRYRPEMPTSGVSVSTEDSGGAHMDRSLWLKPLAEGELTSVVAFSMDAIDEASTKVLLQGHGLEAFVNMSLPLRQCMTLHLFRVVEELPVMLCPTKDSKVLLEQPCDLLSCHRVIEICAGVGGISTGAELSGFVAAAFLDKNDLVCSHLRSMQKSNVLHGSITCDKDIRDLHCSLKLPAHTMCAGFACQPFSYQGDQRGFADERSETFWGTLRCHYLCQSKILILECTQGAGKHPRLQTALKDFAKVMKLQVHQTFLDLEAQWPSRRKRWWCVLYPEDWPAMTLDAWPRSDRFRTIQEIMPTWPDWTAEDLEQLRLTPFEYQMYFQSYPDDERVVNVNAMLPVILHSYGNATSACPCQCRSFGFRPERLQQHGLRGVVLQDQEEFRFLHPLELAYFLGMPLHLSYGSNLRATMCLFGQIASPFQSAWIFAHVQNVLHEMWSDADWVQPLQLIAQLQEDLMFQRHHFLPSFHRRIPTVLHLMKPEGLLTLVQEPGQTVQQLLDAERITTEFGQQLMLLDGGKVVPGHAMLKSQGLHGPYQLHALLAPERPIFAHGLVMIQFTLDTGSHFALVLAGQFLFEAWDKLFNTPCPLLQDPFGRNWRLDDRLWSSLTLFPKSPTGCGLLDFGGLSFDFVNFILESFDLMDSACCVFWQKGLREAYSPRLDWLLRRIDHGLPFQICLLADGHWQLVEGQRSWTTLQLQVLDGLNRSHRPQLMHFLQWLEACVSSCSVHTVFDTPYEQAGVDTCGTLMLGFLLQGHGFLDLDFSLAQQEQELHDHFLMVEECLLGEALGPRGMGPTDEAAILSQLTKLLIEKGVPSSRAEERASMGLKKLGLRELQDAFSNVNPWAYLKGVASRPHISFQWLKSDELQSKIKARATSKFALQPSEKKKKRPGRVQEEQPLVIDPAQLQLLPNTFFAAGKPVAQLPLEKIGANAEGISFATVNDVLPFLTAGSIISDKALGILTTTPIDTATVNTIQVDNLRYPAKYKATDEPVLIQGSLVILGKGQYFQGP